MTDADWPYNLPIWRPAFRAVSPDGRQVAEIDRTCEISMGNPTYGTLQLSAGLQLEYCNPSFLWSTDSRYLAVPQFFARFGAFQRQRLLVIDVQGRSVFASRDFTFYFQPKSFSNGRLVITKNPFSRPREVAWHIPADLGRRFSPVEAGWSDAPPSDREQAPAGVAPAHLKEDRHSRTAPEPVRPMVEAASVRQIIARVGREAMWAPITVLVLHAVGGRLFGHEPYVDPTMHFLGGVAAALFFRHAASVGRALLGAPTHLALDLLAFGSTCGVALFWEFGEFTTDQFLGTQIQRSLGDTMRDLLLGVLGALFYLGAARVGRSFRQDGGS